MSKDIDGPESVSISEAATILGATPQSVRSRILRGTLKAYKNNNDDWCVFVADLKRILKEVEPCDNCTKPATTKIIVKYHFHDRVEFVLCNECAHSTASAYSQRGGVLEVAIHSILGEDWAR
jgi:hypothetical protein